MQLYTSDPRCAEAASEMLRRHERGELEANITSAARDFLTVTDMVKDEEIAEENPNAQVYTAEALAYRGLKRRHETARQSVGEYVREKAHANGLESFWLMLK